MPKTFVIIQLSIVAIGIPAAALLWFVLVRPVPEKTSSGTIRAKNFLDAHTYSRYPSNINRSNYNSQQINIGAAYVFDLEVEGYGKAAIGLDTSISHEFEVGQKVEVRFEVRGFPPVWSRLRVKGIKPAGG